MSFTFTGADIESAQSSHVNGTPQVPIPISVTATVNSSSQITIGWTTPGLMVDGYNIFRSTTSGGPYTMIYNNIDSGMSGTLAQADSGLASSTTYYYVMTTVGTTGTQSVQSSQVSGTTLSALLPPASITVTPTIWDSSIFAVNDIIVTWSASAGATGYDILRSITSGSGYTQIGTSTSTNYSDSTVSPGTTYYYVVKATSGAGNSSNSIQQSGKTYTPLIPPMTSNTTPSGTASASIQSSNAWKAMTNAPFTSSWQSVSAVTSYTLQYQFTTGQTPIGMFLDDSTAAGILVQLQGSNNGSSWTNLTGQFFPNNESGTLFTNTTSYTYFRINYTTTSAASAIVGMFQLYTQ